LKPTSHVPNSSLPVLVYRQVLPTPLSEANAAEYLESNDWSHGGTFKHFPQHHFHTVTHECYAIFAGSTRFLFGKGPLDIDAESVEVDLQAGDVIVDPAGVAHCNIRSSPDFEYIGVYPKVSHVLSRGSAHYPTIFVCISLSNASKAPSHYITNTCRSHRSSRLHPPATNACSSSVQLSRTVTDNSQTGAS